MIAKTFWYLTVFHDETLPCEPTPEGWAQWLATPNEDIGVVKDGDGFDCTAMDVTWHLARVRFGDWVVEPPINGKPDLLTIAFGEGEGWDCDDFLDPDEPLAPQLGEIDGVSYGIWLAAGRTRECSYVATFRADGPSLTIEPVGAQ